MKIKVVIYADFEDVIEIDENEIKKMREYQIDNYIYDKYINKLIDNHVQSDYEIID